MKEFPFEAPIRFMGRDYFANNLPWMYIPALIAIQLTEPAIILFSIGFVSSLWKFMTKFANEKKLLVIFGWFLLPIGLFIVLHSSAYDNFRQFFFVLPPIFILAGIGLESVLTRVNSKVTKLALPILLVLPGVIGIVLLHPYQYIYYNSFVGGERGAEGNFETDYWLTSYREATNYLNANAPTGSRILVLYAGFNVEHNAREDLQVGSLESGIYDSNAEKMIRENYDYVIIPTRYDANITFLPNAEVIYEVRKNGVLLCVIKKVNK
jgi:hypothetical protein